MNNKKVIKEARSVAKAIKKFGMKKLRERLSDLRARAVQHPSSGCRLIQGMKAASEKGYYRITIAESSDTSNSVRVLAHHLVVACRHGGVFPFDTQPGDWDDVGHLCNNKSCLNPDHLVVEKHSINLTRLCCARFLNRHPGYVCPHNPRCIVA